MIVIGMMVFGLRVSDMWDKASSGQLFARSARAEAKADASAAPPAITPPALAAPTAATPSPAAAAPASAATASATAEETNSAGAGRTVDSRFLRWVRHDARATSGRAATSRAASRSGTDGPTPAG